MTDVKISELPEATSVAGSDIAPVVTASATKKITITNLIASIAIIGFGATALALGAGSTIGGKQVCLADGTNCPSRTTPQLSQVVNAGSSATSTPSFDMGFTASTSVVTNASGTTLAISGNFSAGSSTVTKLDFTNATGATVYAGVIRTPVLSVTNATITNGTGTTYALTGNFSAGSSTVGDLNYGHATGASLDAGAVCIGGDCKSAWPASLTTSSYLGPAIWSYATGTETTSTKLYATTLLFANATGTGLNVAALCISGDCKTSWPTTPTSSYYGPIIVSNATGTNVTSTNLFATTLGFTNGTSTGFNTTVLCIGGDCKTAWPTSSATSSFYGSIVTDYSTSTNATSTNLYATTLLFANATGTGLNVTALCIGGDCKTSWPVTPTSSFYGSIVTDNSTSTNATSTNFYSTNILFAGATGTGLSITGTLSAASTTLTTLNFSNATGSSIYAGSAIFGSLLVNGQQVCLANGTNCQTPAAALDTLQSAIARGPYATSTPYFYGGLWASNVMATGTLYATSSVMDAVLWTNASGTTLNLTGSLAAASTTVTTLDFTNATGATIYASTIRAATFCLTGDTCITEWPAGGGPIPTFSQVLEAGNHATTTIYADMGIVAATGTITNATATNLDVSTRLGWLNATGTSLFATSGGFTSLYTAAFTANGTGASSTNFYVSGNTILNQVTVTNATGTSLYATSLGWMNAAFTNATGATLALTGSFSAGSSTVTTFNFTNGTGSNLYVGALRWNSGGATGTSLNLTGAFNAGSSTVTTLNFTNATGSSLSVASLLVNGQLVCLANGTNCPSSYAALTVTTLTTTNITTPSGTASSTFFLSGASALISNVNPVPTSTTMYSGGIPVQAYAFNASTTNCVYTVKGQLRGAWDAGTIRPWLTWTSATGTGATVWRVRAQSLGDDTYEFSSFDGAPSYVTSTLGQGYYAQTELMDLLTVQNAAAGVPIRFEICRLATSAGDTLDQDAYAELLTAEYSLGAYSD
jgi:hypothetical protein